MSSVKKALKKVTKAITGVDPDEGKRMEEEARRQAEEQAKMNAEKAKVDADAAMGQGESDTADPTQAASSKKKKLKEGRKGLSVSRAGGAGINV
ncbi:putative tail assembly protein [Aeromonas phage JELG-KS1]|uniref:Tail assembly protein n=1 Tax=Aeromonas phage JELG-KS1 TaxID=2951233 RepID=A0A9E7NND1_9CAUD|nr:putative tail assembly protein [Aeromonas phage JELG-KS1]